MLSSNCLLSCGFNDLITILIAANSPLASTLSGSLIPTKSVFYKPSCKTYLLFNHSKGTK